MRFAVFAFASLTSLSVFATNDCEKIIDVKKLSIAQELQKGRKDLVSTCEVEQVLAAELKHLDQTGESCEDLQNVKLISVKNQSIVSNSKGQILESKITVASDGLGQPADTYRVEGILKSNSDCDIGKVKLAPMDDGLPNPVEIPADYKHQKN